MASYPTSVWAPATKNTNDVIQAAHINDAQSEIVAIESGLLNGTAPMNSSGSTVATLSVTGGSTFTGAVTFNGAVTVNSTLLASVPTCQVSNSAAIEVANGGFVGLNWDVENFDAAGMHSTASNSSRITFAASTGRYLVGGNLEWSASTGGRRIIRLMLNDTTPIGGDVFLHSDNNVAPRSVSGFVRATSTTDFVTLQVFQDSGSTRSVTAGGTYGSFFWATFQGLK